MLDGGGVARHRMAGLGLVSSALLSGEGHAMLAAAARWCLGDGASAAGAVGAVGAAGAGMLAVLARQSRWQAATLMSLEQVLAVAGAELSTEYTLALSTLAATPPPPPPPPLPTLATSLPERCACPLCGMSAAAILLWRRGARRNGITRRLAQCPGSVYAMLARCPGPPSALTAAAPAFGKPGSSARPGVELSVTSPKVAMV